MMAMNTPIKTIELKKLSKRLLLASAATPFWSPLGIVFLGKDAVGVISLNHMIVTTDFFGPGLSGQSALSSAILLSRLRF